jgi:hypothetical protein
LLPLPWDIEANIKLAKYAARIIYGCYDLPVVPHLYFPQFLDDDSQYERIRGIKLGVELMKGCDLIWVVGTKITSGMEYELNAAKEFKVPVRLYDERLRQIDPTTMLLDERLDDDYRRIVKGLALEKF